MAILTVSKWGNSLGIRIPAEFIKSCSLKEGDRINVTEKDGVLTISKKKTAEDIICEHFHADFETIKAMGIKDAELDWGKEIGEEVLND